MYANLQDLEVRFKVPGRVVKRLEGPIDLEKDGESVLKQAAKEGWTRHMLKEEEKRKYVESLEEKF